MDPNGFQNVDYQNEKESLQGYPSCTSSVTLAQVQMTSQMTSQCPQNLDYVDDEIFNELFPQKESGKNIKPFFIYDSIYHTIRKWCLKDRVFATLAHSQRIILTRTISIRFLFK